MKQNIRNLFAFLVLVTLFFVPILSVFATNNGALEWVKTVGSVGDDSGFSVATDSLNNLYYSGYFEGTVDFDPTAGVDNHTSVGFGDLYISKFNANGDYVWTRTIQAFIGGIAIDPSDNIFVTGDFTGTVDFDPTAGVDNHTSNGQEDIFLSKLSSNGSYLWTKTFGGTVMDLGKWVETDSNGNVYIIGHYRGTVDFDPTAGVDNRSSVSNSQDIYLTKFSNDGVYGWTYTFDGPGTDHGISLSIDPNDNVYLTGRFASGPIDFDPTAGVDNRTAVGSIDAYVVRINENGTYGWTKTFGGTGTDKTFGYDIYVNSDNIFITGQFSGTTDFDPSAGVDNHSSNDASYYDIYVSKLTLSGNFVWAKTFGGNRNDEGGGIITDSDGNIFITGYYSVTSDFDPSDGVDNHTTQGNIDIFLTKFNQDGSYGWTYSFGGTGWDIGYDLALDSNDNLYFTGVFEGTTDFDPTAGVDNRTSSGIGDIFLMKFTGIPPAPSSSGGGAGSSGSGTGGSGDSDTSGLSNNGSLASTGDNANLIISFALLMLILSGITLRAHKGIN